MLGIVKLWGIIMIIAGVIFFLKPNSIKKTVNFFLKDKRLYLGVILSFAIGIIFLRAASRCVISWLVFLLGLVAIAKGAAILVLGKQKIKSLSEVLIKKPDEILRRWALAAIALGVILIYSI